MFVISRKGCLCNCNNTNAPPPHPDPHQPPIVFIFAAKAANPNITNELAFVAWLYVPLCMSQQQKLLREIKAACKWFHTDKKRKSDGGDGTEVHVVHLLWWGPASSVFVPPDLSPSHSGLNCPRDPATGLVLTQFRPSLLGSVIHPLSLSVLMREGGGGGGSGLAVLQRILRLLDGHLRGDGRVKRCALS